MYCPLVYQHIPRKEEATILFWRLWVKLYFNDDHVKEGSRSGEDEQSEQNVPRVISRERLHRALLVGVVP